MGNNGSGFGGSGTVGFNPEKLLLHYSLVGDKASELVRAIYSQYFYQLGDIAMYWASPEAVEFANKLCENANDFLTKSTEILVSVVNNIKAAGDRWSQTTGYTLVLESKESQVRTYKTTLVSNVRESINGIVGVDKPLMSSCIEGGTSHFNDLSECEYAAEGLILNIKDLSFIGAEQMESLIATVNKIVDDMKEKQRSINADAKYVMQQTLDKYSNTGEKISQAFRSLQS